MPRIVEWAAGELPPASERRFLDVAKSDLPDHWTVIHGLRIRQSRSDREIDFLIVDPARGALAVEVKGGRIERSGRDWFSIDGEGVRHAIRNPVDQASAGVYALRSWLRDSASFRGRTPPEVHAAVAFPDVVRTHRELGPDLASDAVLFSDDLHDLKGALDRIFSRYLMNRETGPPRSRGSHRRRRLSRADVDAFVRVLEPPEYSLRAHLAARVDRNRRLIERLTDEQARALDFLEHQRRAAIHGSAGTGKTVLAELKAGRLARMGQRVLLLCFNQGLAGWLSSRAEGFEARHFHGFCRDRASAARLDFEVPKTAKKEKVFWENTAPELLMEALERCSDDRYDAIIVDEGQDFRRYWWLAVEAALRDERDGVLFAFFDPNQNIYGGEPPDALPVHPYPLIRNCRNTRRIAAYAADLIGIPCEVYPNAPNGERVASLRYRTPEEMVRQVQKQLHRLVAEEKVRTEQIAVLSTHKTSRSHLAGKRRLGNFNLTARPQRPSDIRFTSLHAFKGLESDVVILVDVDGNPQSCSDRHLYVASTRAQELLIVLEEAPAA